MVWFWPSSLVLNRYELFPTYLIANLALVDLLNAAINVPLYMIYTVLQVSWDRRQPLAIKTSFFSRLFAFLNLASM